MIWLFKIIGWFGKNWKFVAMAGLAGLTIKFFVDYGATQRELGELLVKKELLLTLVKLKQRLSL